MRALALLVVLASVTGCVRERSEPAASPQAGCEATGGKWHSVTQTCEKR
jgi:hypothetical protein